MHFLDKKLRNFWLHESRISGIVCEDTQLVIIFDKGFFGEDHVQKNNCRILVNIHELTPNNTGRYVNITRTQSIVKNEISLFKFNRLLNKYRFVVDLEYYSEFERSMFLIGYVNGAIFHFKITDIDEISFFYE